MDTWLIWNLTGAHVTDVTNASRTLLMNLMTLDWDSDILALLGIPRKMLPRIASSLLRACIDVAAQQVIQYPTRIHLFAGAE